jgi:cytochrome c biogenesis factor
MQGVLPLIGAQRVGTMDCAGTACRANAVSADRVSFACLAQSFLANDFSVAYVANHSNTQLPALYRFAAVWGGHEGSLLLWVLMLAGWGAAVSLASRQLPEVMVARVLGVLGWSASACWLSSCLPPIRSPACCRRPPKGVTSTPCCRTPAWCFIRRCCTWAMSAFRSPLPLP